MSKNGKQRTWNMRLLALALTMVLAISPLFSGIYAEASTTKTLDVADYKGDRAESEWLVPEESGKLFAGWYTDDTFSKVYTGTTGNAVAKFVDAKVLTVKKQLSTAAKSTDATTNVRFLTAIDNLWYKGVTFNIEVPESGKTWDSATETVAYSAIIAEENGQSNYKYANAEFGTEDAQLFVAHSFTGIPNAAFGWTITVTPSWETMDGTIVTGTPLSFSINEALLEGSLFADKVSVNGATVNSALANWDISQVNNNIVTGTDNVWDKFYTDPIYFNETGTTMLLQSTITNVTETITGEPVAGLYVTDGTNKGYFGLTGSNIVYGQWADKWQKDVMTYAVLSQWGNKTVKLDVVLKDGVFAIYADEIFLVNMTVNDVMFTGTYSGDLAFGPTLRMVQNTSGASMKFTVTNFTTDAAEVNEFLLVKNLSSNSLFAEKVEVNGTTVTSALDYWNLIEVTQNIVTGTDNVWDKFYLDPIYFNKTGTTMLLQSTITNVTETITGEPVAGLYVTDGTNKGYFGLTGSNIVYGQWADKWQKDVMTYAVLSQWGNKTVKLDVVLKDGVFAIYADEILIANMLVNDVMFTGTHSGDLAFGPTLRMVQNTSGASMKFTVTNFTTDATEVDAFIAEKAAQ